MIDYKLPEALATAVECLRAYRGKEQTKESCK